MPMRGISFLVSKAQQKGLNDGNTACGKWFYRPVILSTLDTQDLAEHMMDHGSPYGEDVIKGVLEKFFGCAFELLMQNRRIKMGGLGTLGISITTEPADSSGELVPDSITNAKITLIGDDTDREQLSSTKLRQRMSFTSSVSSSFVNLSDPHGSNSNSGGNSGNSGDENETPEP